MSDLKLNHMYSYTHIHACTHSEREMQQAQNIVQTKTK